MFKELFTEDQFTNRLKAGQRHTSKSKPPKLKSGDKVSFKDQGTTITGVIDKADQQGFWIKKDKNPKHKTYYNFDSIGPVEII